MKVIGLDPGTYKLGYGVLSFSPNHDVSYIDSGILTPKGAFVGQRLSNLSISLSGVFKKHRPDHVAIEKVFVHTRNMKSSLVLGMALGLCYQLSSESECNLFQYDTRKVKKFVTGYGGSDKASVANIISRFLNIEKEFKSLDESDALAVAWCHCLSFQPRISETSFSETF